MGDDLKISREEAGELVELLAPAVAFGTDEQRVAAGRWTAVFVQHRDG